MAYVRSRSVGTSELGSPNVLAKAVGDAYAVDGFEPELAFDFTGETYRTDGSATTFSGAMTHSATSLGTMVDGYGPELFYPFDNITGDWTLSNGIYSVSGATTTSDLKYSSAFFNLSKIYQVTYTLSNVSGTLTVFVGEGSGAAPATNGTHTVFADPTQTYLIFRASTGASATVSNISVREVPAIKWRPHNLLTYSEDFTTGWVSGNTTETPNVTTAPDGALTADLLVPSASSGTHNLHYGVTQGSGTFTFSVWAKAAGYPRLGLRVYDGTAYRIRVTFDISAGTIVLNDAGVATIQDAGNGWYLCSCTGTSPSGNMGVTSGWTIESLPDGYTVQSVFTGDGVSGAYLWGAHLYRSDLGGMVDNPDRGDSYVPTAARVLPSAPELATNGTFNSGIDGWTPSGSITSWNSAGYVDVNGTTGGGGLYRDFSVTSNTHYVISVDIFNVVSGTPAIYFYDGANFTTILKEFTATGSAVVKPTSSTIRVYIYGDTSGPRIYSADNISIKESYIDPSVARYLPRRGHYVYNDQAWTNRGLLLESEARTNGLTYSEDFTDASWSKLNTATLAIDATGPDGQTSAVTFVDSGATGTGAVRIFKNVTVSTSTTYTYSLFAKADQLSKVLLYVNSFTTPANNGYIFDLTDGTYTAYSGTPDMTPLVEDYGNGWYRCSVTFTTDAADTSGQLSAYVVDVTETVALDGTSSILIYGAQLEAGSTPSSYMPTEGATFTRAAETLTVAAADLPYSSTAMGIQMQGTMTRAVENASVTAMPIRWSLDGNNQIRIWHDSSIAGGGVRWDFDQEENNVIDQVSSGYIDPFGINVPFNIASRHGSTFINGAVDGTALTANTTPTALPDLSATNLQLGYDFMGTIDEFRMWGSMDIGDTTIASATS